MSRKVSVVHIVTRLDFGGAQQNTLHTVRTLDRDRFTPVLVYGPGGTLDSEVPGLGIRAIPLASLIRELSPFTDLLCLLQLTHLLLDLKPEVVHTHSSKAGILGRLAAFCAGVPVVIHTYHGFGFNDKQPRPTRTLYVAAERLCALVSTALIFVSKANAEEAQRLGIKAPHERMIRSGVRLSSFPAKVDEPLKKKASLGLGMHKPLVTSIGNLKPQKNPVDFIVMAGQVAKAQKDATFLFIGEGPLRTACEGRVMGLGLHGKVALPGWRKDAAELLAVSDVFVLTSLWEGLPRALVEAMKSGLPCVCYDADGVTDILKDGENGFVVRRGDVDTLASRVSQLLADEALRKKLGAAAADSIGPDFDIDGMVRRQEELYTELLAHG